MVCNPPPGRRAAWLTAWALVPALAAGCDGTISSIHRSRGVSPVVYPAPVSSAAQGRPDEPKQIRAQHLLVMHRESRNGVASVQRTRAEARARADEALRKIRAGGDVDQIVRDYSDEPGAAERSGDLGRFNRRMMVKTFSDAAFRLKVGEVSDVVESEFGFHVIRRTE
ncbi:MAG: peptidyl-prolyl cis-trans isomerase [Polyangiaceae bacterium]|nr:peptidyl-prolyl cis-trans isomerase [Polyangiaceae bacterium]